MLALVSVRVWSTLVLPVCLAWWRESLWLRFASGVSGVARCALRH